MLHMHGRSKENNQDWGNHQFLLIRVTLKLGLDCAGDFSL